MTPVRLAIVLLVLAPIAAGCLVDKPAPGTPGSDTPTAADGIGAPQWRVGDTWEFTGRYNGRMDSQSATGAFEVVSVSETFWGEPAYKLKTAVNGEPGTGWAFKNNISVVDPKGGGGMSIPGFRFPLTKDKAWIDSFEGAAISMRVLETGTLEGHPYAVVRGSAGTDGNVPGTITQVYDATTRNRAVVRYVFGEDSVEMIFGQRSQAWLDLARK